MTGLTAPGAYRYQSEGQGRTGAVVAPRTAEAPPGKTTAGHARRSVNHASSLGLDIGIYTRRFGTRTGDGALALGRKKLGKYGERV
jgi:hypothetical protein